MRLSVVRPSLTFLVVLATAATVAVRGALASDMTADEFEDLDKLPVDFESGAVRGLLQDVCHIDMTSIPVTERNVITALRESQPELLREQAECMVCFECLHADSLSTLSCSHAMHRKCFKKLRRPRACPKCRHEGPHEDIDQETVFKKALRVFEQNGWVPPMPQGEIPTAEEEQEWSEAGSEPEEPSLGDVMEVPFTTFVDFEYTSLFMVALGTLNHVVDLIDTVAMWDPSTHARTARNLAALKEHVEEMNFGEQPLVLGEPPNEEALANVGGSTELVAYLREYIAAVLQPALVANMNAAASRDQHIEVDPRPAFVRQKLTAALALMSTSNNLLYSEDTSGSNPRLRFGISPVFGERMSGMVGLFERLTSTLHNLAGNHGWNDDPAAFLRYMDEQEEYHHSLQRVMHAWAEAMQD